jgi:hypothetical protein
MQPVAPMWTEGGHDGGENRGQERWHHAAWRLGGRGGWDLPPSAQRHDGPLTANRQATDSRTQGAKARSKGRVVEIRERNRSLSKTVPNAPKGQVMGLASGQASAGEKKEVPQSGQEEEVAGASCQHKKRPEMSVVCRTKVKSQGEGARGCPQGGKEVYAMQQVPS